MNDNQEQSPRVVLGVVAAPGPAAGLAQQLVNDGLRATIESRLHGADWRVDVLPDRLVQPPASDAEIVEATRRLLLDRDWDIAICLTDLPLHLRRRPVVAHANPMYGVAVLSVPALGPVGRRQRVRETIIGLIEQLLGETSPSPDRTARRAQRLTRRVRELGTDTATDPYAFTARVLTGNLRLLTGMVRANHPWRLTLRLSRALAAAAAVGVFALVTSDIWRLADSLGVLRLIGTTIGSIVAIAATLIIGANLWERPTRNHIREQVVLFNLATAGTVLIGVAALYLALLVVAGIAAAWLVVPHSFSEALGHRASLSDYAELAWLTCSLATLGGALGAGLESDEAVREAAYARRVENS